MITHYWNTFERYYLRGIGIFVACVIIAVSVGFFMPIRYTSTSQLLIVQKQSSIIDAYTAYRAAERTGRNLVHISQSGSFRDKVFAQLPMSQYGEFADIPDIAQAELWERTVRIRLIPDSTILRVSVDAPSVDSAIRLNDAINSVLSNRFSDYLGADQKIVINVIDMPSVGNRPSQPDFFVLGGIGVLLGFVVTSAYFWKLSARFE